MVLTSLWRNTSSNGCSCWELNLRPYQPWRSRFLSVELHHTQNTYFLRACGRCRAQHRQLYRNVHDGEQSSPPLTYLTRCSMNLTEQFLFLKNPISEASANTTHTSRYRKQTHAWLWWYKAIPDTSSCALRLTHRQLLCLAATHKYNTAKEGRQTLVKHTRRCHVSLLTRCVRETGGQKHCILI